MTLSRHAAVFAPQYRSRSGPGSTPAFSAPYREFLRAFIVEHDVRSVLDLGCGDLEIMSLVDLNGASYLGLDVIEQRVEANRRKNPSLPCRFADLTACDLPPADLIICKDVLQHWTNAEVSAFLARLMMDATFRHALVTNCNYGTPNQDIRTGGWRPLDLTAQPFHIGEVVFRWGDQRSGGEKDVVMIDGSTGPR